LRLSDIWRQGLRRGLKHSYSRAAEMVQTHAR
jgi:hypothetical protein